MGRAFEDPSLHGFTPPDPELDPEVAEWFLSGPWLPEEGLVQEFELPERYLADRPPKFEQLKRNLWVSRRPPKRQSKEEISICSCTYVGVLWGLG